jgi:hypothetical protein
MEADWRVQSQSEDIGSKKAMRMGNCLVKLRFQLDRARDETWVCGKGRRFMEILVDREDNKSKSRPDLRVVSFLHERNFGGENAPALSESNQISAGIQPQLTHYVSPVGLYSTRTDK